VSDQDERARQFVDYYTWSWDSIIDHSRTKAKRLGADYQPAMFAIDEDGTLVGSYIGYGDPSNTGAWEALAAKLQ
jgi:hypothetical protein